MARHKRHVSSVYVAQFTVNLALLAAALSLVIRRMYLDQAVYYYDVYSSSLCALVAGQLAVVSCWNSLLEPRSALRWMFLFVLSLLAAATTAIVFYFCALRFKPGDEGIALFAFAAAAIATFGVLLVGRVFAWPFVHVTSLRLEYEQTPAEMTTPYFSLREFLWWIGAVAAMLWYARAVFESQIVHVLILETVLLRMLVLATTGMALALPVLVCAMVTGLGRRWRDLVVLVVAVIIMTLLEINIAWNLPVSWKTFAWSTLLYNALFAATVSAHFAILHAVGLRLVRTD